MGNIAYYNGTFGQAEELTVPFLDRAIFFGDGCYDAAFVMNGKPLDFDWHLDRFFNSCRLMRIDFPHTRDELSAILLEAVARSGADTALLYWQTSRGVAARNHCFPGPDVKPTLLITVNEKTMPDVYTPVPMITVTDTRHHHCNIKTLNLFPNVMANQAAHEAGAYEAIFIRPDGRVTEGSHCNAHILKNGEIITHPDGDWILPGITKKALFEVAETVGVAVQQRSFTAEELFAADEVFVTGSSTFIKRASSLDGKPCAMADEATYKKLADEFMRRANELTK